ncbi:LOW QUALITY PROTEIN: hypothetical protein EUGRSUZ_K01861 [Eucalyptus grandis]|uniref:Uncharacterized protein n=1 Tax=Eucalyptus grandis TaxID=71139 RepID=A0ACC3IWC2_EUCGR|nr:LOW QUALITY PROTEIN: hypothetical protein EUGRSUZ_K01861 [Eucalyptus grandis]
MAESLLFNIADNVLGKIASPALQEAVAIYSVKNQIRELRETLTAIKAVLSDAEALQAKSNNLQVWLDLLQRVFYDAEDVLDDLECEALRKQVISHHGSVKGKVRCFFSLSNPLMFRAKINHKIKEIQERLSKICTEKDQLNLNMRIADNGAVHTDIDKENIIEVLMRPYNRNLSVFPIIGIGGMGKTTLTKLVYNDGIIKDATHQNLSNLDIRQSQTFLQDIIKDKKFLLVLNDVWSNDRNRWKEVRNMLTGGASESKIIVTTHSAEVASIMGTDLVYNLKGLSHEHCMNLFKKWAFDKKEKRAHPNLLEIGNDIVKKSQGVPLLVKTLRSLLYSKDDDGHWKYVRDSETWKSSNEGLALARSWMALGLISSKREKLALEDVGIEYVKELWKRSLIQEVKERGAELLFKVHDSVHSLATSVAQNDFSIVRLNTSEISKGVQHISFYSTLLEGISNVNGVPPFLRKPTSKRPRVIYFQYQVNDGVITREFARTCISKCNLLRYLDFSYSNFEELPRSTTNLKQLRSLSLYGNKLLKKFPSTICDLLLELSLIGCLELGNLPKNMKKLVSPRYRYNTTKQKSLQENGIQYLEGLNECTNLQLLFEVMELLRCLEGSAYTLESFLVYDCLSLTNVPEWLPNHTCLRLIYLIRCPNLLSVKQRIRSLTSL